MKTIRQKLSAFHKSPKRLVVTVVLVILVLLMGGYAYYRNSLRSMLEYSKSLDRVAISVNGTDRTLREVAFYVAYEEMEVEEQARIYDAADTQKYWNLHIDGVFVNVAARNASAQMAVHDEVFYQKAVEAGEELTEEEREALENKVADFWNDLSDYDGETRMGITYEDVYATMERIALAQRYQSIYAKLQNREYEDYDFSGESYQELLEENDYSIKTDIWKRIDFGNVILSH